MSNANDTSVEVNSTAGLGEITIVLRPSNIAMTQYIGTRAQLEEEGIIPAGTAWPAAFEKRRWSAGEQNFQLRREKPEGMKGKQRDFIDCDNWCLRVTTAASYWPEDHVEIQRKKLADAIYFHTPEGRAEFNRKLEAYWAAKEDKKFQAFKALIPGLVPPPRQRRRPATGQPDTLA
jgi:hypothetical protein